MENNRRGFLKKVGAMSAGAALVSANPLLAIANEASDSIANAVNKGEFTLSILQTTDVHCQVHPHDELFWENDQAVFRKTGGYAHLATYLRKEKKRNPNTFIIDTGDMFQGSELSVKTSGKQWFRF
jgi:sulfur-oxidizing protein SoxB